MKAESNKDTNKMLKIISIIVLIIILVFAIILFVFTSKSETKTIGEKQDNKKISSLKCESSKPDEPFFVSSKSLSSLHTMHIVFDNQGMREISYTYNDKFSTSEQAISARDQLHADYNIFLGKNNIDHEKYYPSFSVSDTSLQINLYATRNNINPMIAKIFFIDEHNYEVLQSYSHLDYEKLFNEKGFICTFSE